MNKKIFVIGVPILVVVLLSVGVWWLFNSGRLVYVAPGSKAPEGVAVCGNDFVEKYNEATYRVIRGDSNEATMDEPALKKLKTDITNKNGYEDDATCQTILFWLALHYDDRKEAEVSYKAVKSLHEKGAFANSNLQGNQAISTYDSFLNALKSREEAKGN